ncbi:AAA domain containing protein [uncultured Caudovirales phage]|uniref:AAA domain containing protein n=1 Tax=uncultured Caudovirales phage TaxID=2100421 RepID=A0A6J5KP37_9CAUD|nr:AAA domain containing protein [uncultured Caudovirales phage]
MTYAVILQSNPTKAVTRQTAIVPDSVRGVRIFTRNGSGQRGSAGAWQERLPSTSIHETLVGEPTAIAITDNDERDLASGNTPSVLLQKLVRKCSGFTEVTVTPFDSVFSEIVAEAKRDPEALGIYTASRPQTLSPAIEVIRETVAQPVAPPVAPVAPTESVIQVHAPSEFAVALSVPQLTDPQVSVYIPRTDVYGMNETDVFKFAQQNQRVIGIEGHAGTGKTSSARYNSAVLGLPFLRVECSFSIEDSVTQGKFVPDGNGGLRWEYSALARAIQEPAVILLNEASRMSPKNAPLFLGLLEERELIISQHLGETIKVHPECIFVLDYNSNYRGTAGLDQALQDRMGIKVTYKWSEEAEAIRVPSESLRQLAKELRIGAELEDKFSTPVTTRLLLNFVEQAKGLSFNFAVQSFLNAFPIEEQDALRMLVEVYSSNIATELGASLVGLNL